MLMLPPACSIRRFLSAHQALRAAGSVFVAFLLFVAVTQAPAQAVTPPQANPDSGSTDEDTILSVNAPGVLRNDKDPDGNPLTVIDYDPTSGQGASVIVHPDGSYTYDPTRAPSLQSLANGESIGDTFSYTIGDDVDGTDTAIVTITVNGVNDPPMAVDDSGVGFSTNEDSPFITANVLNNDSDPDTGDILSVTAFDATATTGTVIDNGNGTFGYDPSGQFDYLQPGQTAEEIFTYTVNDGSGGSDTATVTITVGGLNDPPWITPIVPNRATNEDTIITIDLSPFENDVESSDTDLDWTVANEDHCAVSGENSDDDILSFSPDPNYYGSDTVLLILTDADGGTSTQSITLTWNPINDPPTVDPLPDQTLDEDGTLDNAIDLWAYASDVETADSGLLFTIDNNPHPNAGITIDSNRYIDIRPATNWNGTTDVRIKVTDPGGLFALDTFRVTTKPVKDAPWIDPAVPDLSADEDIPITIDLTAYEHDVESSGTDLDWTVSGETHCTVSGEASDDDVLTFTPHANYYGSDSVLLILTDADGGTDTQSITLTWNPINDPPTLDPLPDQSLDEDGTLDNAIDLWAYASDVETADSGLTFAIDNSPAPDPNVGVTIDGNRYIDIRPAANWFGVTDVQIKVTDPGGASATDIFQITVNSINDPPTATDNSYRIQEDTTDNMLYPLIDDSDIEGDRLTLLSVGSPVSGTIKLVESNTALAYTPDADFYGSEAFTYTVSDGNGGNATARINIQVENVNDDPVAEDDVADVLEDSGSNVIDVLRNDTYLPDPVENLVIVSATPASYGTIAIALDGSYLSYTPDPNFYGSDVFSYTVTDGNGGSTSAEVQVAVSNVNDDPIARNDDATVNEDSSNNRIDVLENDTYLPDPFETLTIVDVQRPAHGQAHIDGENAVLRYTPDADYYGPDTLTYTIDDGNGGFASGTVTITVRNVNDNPLARGDSAEVQEDSGATPIEVLTNDTYLPDPFETLTIVGVTRGKHGSVTIADGGARLKYRPDPDFYGTDTFAYTISDGNGGYDTTSVDVTVLGINDRPDAESDSAITQEDTPVTIDVLDNDSDRDGDLVPSTVEVTSDPGHGATSVNSDSGEVTYTPKLNWNGDDTFVYRVCDDGMPLPSMCNTATVAISVGSVNDPPISDAGSDQEIYTNARVTLDGSASSDPDNDLPLVYQWLQIGGPPVVLSSTSAEKPTFTAPDDPAILTFTLRVIDAKGRADLIPDEIVVTVRNQPPISDAGPGQTRLAGSLVALDGSGSFDPDTDLPLSYLWAQIGGPTVTLSSETTAKPTFTAPEQSAVLTFALYVIDSLGEPDPTPDRVMIQIDEPFRAYLPLVANRHTLGPDLVIQSITAHSNGVQLVIGNQGNQPVLSDFWVDVYIDPRTPPTGVNQPWYELADEGLVWGISGQGLAALKPGGTLILTTGDRYYFGDYSVISWPLHEGTPIYGQVDSLNPGTLYGTVLETHEVEGSAYNNIYGPAHVSAGATSAATPLSALQGPIPLGDLPPRP